MTEYITKNGGLDNTTLLTFTRLLTLNLVSIIWSIKTYRMKG